MYVTECVCKAVSDKTNEDREVQQKKKTEKKKGGGHLQKKKIEKKRGKIIKIEY